MLSFLLTSAVRTPNKWEISYPVYCFSQSCVIAQYHRRKRQEGKAVQSRPPSVCVWYETLHTKIMILAPWASSPVVFSKTLPVALVLCSPRVRCRKCSFTKEWPKVRHLGGNKGILYRYQRFVQIHEFILDNIWCVSSKAELSTTSKIVIITARL